LQGRETCLPDVVYEGGAESVREKGRPCEVASLHFVNFTGQAVAGI